MYQEKKRNFNFFFPYTREKINCLAIQKNKKTKNENLKTSVRKKKDNDNNGDNDEKKNYWKLKVFEKKN